MFARVPSLRVWRDDKAGRWSTCDVILRRVLATTVTVEKSVIIKYCECSCSLSYPARTAHAPYCHLRPSLLYNIFSTLFHKLHDILKKLLNIKCVFWFSLQFLSETFLIMRRINRDMIKKCMLVFMWSTVTLVWFYWNLNFSYSFTKTNQISNFMKNPPCDSRIVACGQMDRRTHRQTLWS